MISQLSAGLMRVAAVALLAVSGTVVAPVPSAHAQSFFEALFGGFSGGPRPQRRGYAPSDERYPTPEFNGERHAGGEGRGSGTLCVRLCDGRHFPIPRAASGVALNSAKVCSSLCPAAKTQVFNGSKPDHAVASDGTRYTDLENAFVYRERNIDSCSCTGNGPGGLAQIDIESDPTLRAGDVVATADGLSVFKGSRGYPYKTADFTPVGDYGRVNSDLRRSLANIKVDPTATSATPVQSLASADEEKPAAAVAKPRRRAPRQAAQTEPVSSFGWFR